MGPLALMAKSAGYQVFGTDLKAGAIAPELKEQGITVHFGAQDGQALRAFHAKYPIDWFIHTSALPPDHPELLLAQKLHLKISKRDEFIAFLVKQLHLKMIAVAGTHGKTTTTAMLVWAAKQLRLPVSYLVGTTLPFAPAGLYHPESQFFFYEADEYDRNFLHFHPFISIITTVSYDHPDIYPTPAAYFEAFHQFISQSQTVIFDPLFSPNFALTLFHSPLSSSSSSASKSHLSHPSFLSTPLKSPQDVSFTLSGEVRRQDAKYAYTALLEAMSDTHQITPDTPNQLLQALNAFPGSSRRFEKITSGVYTDYAHHPEEVAATLAMAREEARKLHLKGVVALYEPHQNSRQHLVKDQYPAAFAQAHHVLWLPTFLAREDPTLPVITASEFTAKLRSVDISATPVTLGAKLSATLKDYRDQGYLILLMSAGPADAFFRQVFTSTGLTK